MKHQHLNTNINELETFINADGEERVKDSAQINLEKYIYAQRSDYCEPVIERLLNLQLPKHNSPNPPYLGVIKSEKSFQSLIRTASLVNDHERPLHEKAVQKWIVEQGGSFSFEQLTKNIFNYTNPTVCAKEFDPRQFREAVQLAICKYMTVVLKNIIIEDARALFNTFSATHRSSGGLDCEGDRRKNVIPSLTNARKYPLNFTGVIAWMRYKDSKYRNIFVDSLSNYFREARVLFSLFKAWHELPIDHHYSNREMAERIVTHQSAAAAAWDCKGMDFHMNIDSFKLAIDILCDMFHVPNEQRNYVKWVVEDIMSLDIHAGDEVFVGPKAMLSGLFPTHDIESVLTFSVACVVFNEMGYTFTMARRKLRKNEFTVYVCGDDSIVLVGSEFDTELANSLAAKTWALVGQVMELTKTEFGTETITFCKRTFALRYGTKGFTVFPGTNVPVSKYPVVKCLNSLYHPENLPTFSSKRLLILWFATIMDNSYGSTSWKSTVIQVVQANPELFVQVEDINEADRAEYANWLQKDWYIRTFGDIDSFTMTVIKDTVKRLKSN